jgi:hypothetical protein
MSNALNVIGFYFTLVGFISGLFFTRIDSWYGSVRAFHGKLAFYTRREEFIAARAEASGLSASAPTVSFIAVGVFVTLLGALALFFPARVTEADPAIFIYAPLAITIAAYWLGGVIFILQARTLLSSAQVIIERGISG